MDFRRFSVGLCILGLIVLASGLGLWFARMPEVKNFQDGYSQCLWSSTYKVTRDALISDWLGQTFKGQGMFIDNSWDPDNAPCDIAKDGWKPQHLTPEYMQRELDAIMRGIKFSYVRSRPPIFFTAYFLNGLGLLIIVFAGWIFFAVPRHPILRD